MRKLPACCAIIALLFCISGIAVQDNIAQIKSNKDGKVQKIKVETDLQEVQVVVTDKKGRIIENLTKDDFELLENGRPQEISFFTVSVNGPPNLKLIFPL